MSTQESVNQNSALGAQEPAVTPESIVVQLRAVRQQIPEYGQLPSSDLRSLAAAAHVHPDFTQAAIGAMGASATVLSAVGTNPEDVQREVLRTIGASDRCLGCRRSQPGELHLQELARPPGQRRRDVELGCDYTAKEPNAYRAHTSPARKPENQA